MCGSFSYATGTNIPISEANPQNDGKRNPCSYRMESFSTQRCGSSPGLGENWGGGNRRPDDQCLPFPSRPRSVRRLRYWCRRAPHAGWPASAPCWMSITSTSQSKVLKLPSPIAKRGVLHRHSTVLPTTCCQESRHETNWVGMRGRTELGQGLGVALLPFPPIWRGFGSTVVWNDSGSMFRNSIVWISSPTRPWANTISPSLTTHRRMILLLTWTSWRRPCQSHVVVVVFNCDGDGDDLAPAPQLDLVFDGVSVTMSHYALRGAAPAIAPSIAPPPLSIHPLIYLSSTIHPFAYLPVCVTATQLECVSRWSFLDICLVNSTCNMIRYERAIECPVSLESATEELLGLSCCLCPREHKTHI